MPKDDNSGWVEADVTVNGTALTFAQVMCLRVAIGTFLMQLSDEKYREALGPALTDGYTHHLGVVQNLMVKP